MSDLIQYVIVGTVILAAAVYLIKRLRGKTGVQGICGCCRGGCPGAANQAPPSLKTSSKTKGKENE